MMGRWIYSTFNRVFVIFSREKKKNYDLDDTRNQLAMFRPHDNP